MRPVKADIGSWNIVCQPDDGARISVLQYAGYDLLTSSPISFKAPEKDYGEYENRPVYGYDDCFPTIEECKYPSGNFGLKDHGDVCWQSWQVIHDGKKLICTTDLKRPELTLARTLEFKRNVLSWQFEVINRSNADLPFLHVMHPLMPLAEIESLEISDFGEVYSETKSVIHNIEDSKALNEYLQNIKTGFFEMLFVKKVSEGIAWVGFKNGMKLKIEYNQTFYQQPGSGGITRVTRMKKG